MSNKVLRFTLATAAAFAFSAVPMSSAMAEGTTEMDKAATTMPEQAKANEVTCFGANACKGQSKCRTAKNACHGQNECKGQGMALMQSEKECTDASGKTKE